MKRMSDYIKKHFMICKFNFYNLSFKTFNSFQMELN